MVIVKLFKYFIKIVKYPLILFYNIYEIWLIKNKKIFKKLKNFVIYYNILDNYKALPNLKSKYFLINYYKLKFKCYFLQSYYILTTLYKIRINFVEEEKYIKIFKVKSLNNKSVLEQNYSNGIKIEIYYRKKIKKVNKYILYIKNLRKNYLNDYYFRYMTGKIENEIRDYRSVMWERLDRRKENIIEIFIGIYCSIIFRIIWIIQFFPFNFIISIIYFIVLIFFLFFYESYTFFFTYLYPRYVRFKFKCNLKYKRFKEYSFIPGLKAVICILYTKYRKTIPDYIEYYRENLKNTKVGIIFGPIYNFLGLWSGNKKGIWKGLKKI